MISFSSLSFACETKNSFIQSLVAQMAFAVHVYFSLQVFLSILKIVLNWQGTLLNYLKYFEKVLLFRGYLQVKDNSFFNKDLKLTKDSLWDHLYSVISAHPSYSHYSRYVIRKASSLQWLPSMGLPKGSKNLAFYLDLGGSVIGIAIWNVSFWLYLNILVLNWNSLTYFVYIPLGVTMFELISHNGLF